MAMTTMIKKVIRIANNLISKSQSSRWQAKKIGLLITDWIGLNTPLKQLASFWWREMISIFCFYSNFMKWEYYWFCFLEIWATIVLFSSLTKFKMTNFLLYSTEKSTVKGAIVEIPSRILDITMYRLESGIMI